MDLAKMFASQNENLDIHNHNLNSEIYQEELKQNQEIILKKFQTKVNKNLEDKMNSEQILAFLDGCLEGGKKFDRSIAKKILSVLESSDDQISVFDFTNTYIQILEELKLNIQEIQSNFQSETINLANYNKIAAENKNEVLNQEGINEKKATFNINRLSVQFANPELIPNISINMKYENDSKATGPQNSGYVWEGGFEFNVTKKSFILFELRSKGEVLGEIQFRLGAVESQEEYEVVLEVNERNSKKLIAKINCKIKFVWSLFKYSQDMINKTEKKIQKYNETIRKSNNILDTLNDPFNFYRGGSKGLSGAESGEKVFDLGLYQMTKRTLTANRITSLTGVVEKQMKDILKRDNLVWLPLIRYTLLCLIAIAFLSTFAQANFVDILVPGYMLLIISTTLNLNYLGYLNQFYGLTLCLFAYDIFWLFFASAFGTDYDGGVENFLKGFVFLIKFISLLVKAFLTVALISEIQKAEKNPNQDPYAISTNL